MGVVDVLAFAMHKIAGVTIFDERKEQSLTKKADIDMEASGWKFTKVKDKEFVMHKIIGNRRTRR